MGHFSMEIDAPTGSNLSGNQQRKLMEAWQAFAESKPMAKVLPPVARIERSS